MISCTYIFCHILSFHFVLSYPVILYYSYTSYTFVRSYSIYHILCAFVYFHYFSCVHILIFISIYTVLLVLITVYFHCITRLCFSYHIISYTFHIHFLCVYFSFSFIFMLANILEADSGNNWVYPKVLSLYETVISVYCGDPFGATVIQTGSMSSTQTGPRYLSMYLLQQLYLPYRHAYLSLYQVLSR